MRIEDYTRRNKMVQAAIDFALDDSHGYDQRFRWGEYGDYDCSSLAYTVATLAGYDVCRSWPRYTGTLRRDFISAGFSSLTFDGNLYDLEPGDILLNEQNHVAICIGNGQLVEAAINENGDTTGGQPGDQTGQELRIRSVYNYPWNYCICPPLDYIDLPDPVKRKGELWEYHGGDMQLMHLEHNTDGSVCIINKQFGLALDLDSGIIDNGNPINFYTPNGLDTQKWYIVQDLDGPSEPKNIAPYVLVSKLGYNKVLDAATPDNGKNGNALVLYDNLHETNRNQMWYIEDMLDGYVVLRSVMWPNMVLDCGDII